MNTRRASCSCGQLQLTIEGEPSRIAMCHCLECQRRTGAVLSNQARFRLEQISFAGKTTAGTRMAESGNAMTYHFCPICGSTVFFFLDVRNDDKRSNTGTVIERNTLRVTPPSTNSRKREWP